MALRPCLTIYDVYTQVFGAKLADIEGLTLNYIDPNVVAMFSPVCDCVPYVLSVVTERRKMTWRRGLSYSIESYAK